MPLDQPAALAALRKFVLVRRRTLGISQAELAERAGISKPTVSRLEQMTLESLPKISTLEKLAHGLEVRFEDLEAIVLKGEGTGTLAKARVLVVEDEESLCKLWKLNLERAGYATVTADNGEAALAVINYAEPDVVVMDIMMPGINGLDLMRYLRKDLGFKGAVIVVTARDEKAPGEYVAAGANDVLLKNDPTFSNQRLVELVGRQLQRAAG